MKRILSVVIISLAAITVKAQVGIGTPSPDGTAALDITATDKGLLVPRMSVNDRMNIVKPAPSLLVYQTDGAPGFYYNAGTANAPVWTLLLPNSTGLTVQGNTFNNANQLVQLDASTKLPVANGNNLTSLNAANLTGIVAPARLGTGTTDTTTFLRGDGKWTAPASGGGGGNGTFSGPIAGGTTTTLGTGLTDCGTFTLASKAVVTITMASD
ncbi:MAG: hypothetical protein HY305_07880, partial [Sphingobacteriales bacterium]|nr:hypothetical protein [Sphingobacteriales bacterium]